jgi:uracil-DNA glycosylase family 4
MSVSSVFSLREEIMQALKHNAHLALRRQYVYPNGPMRPDIMLVGDAPTDVDEEKNLAFAGDAGLFIGELLPRGVVATFTHVLKLRPAKSSHYLNGEPQSDNRKPTREEVDFFVPFLLQELEAYQPKVVVALGNIAGSALTGDREFRVAGHRGDVMQLHGRPTLFTYHPSFVQRLGQRHRPGEERDALALDLGIAGRLVSR